MHNKMKLRFVISAAQRHQEKLHFDQTLGEKMDIFQLVCTADRSPNKQVTRCEPFNA